jgi:hypothetical protein
MQSSPLKWTVVFVALLFCHAGCSAPSARLTFPAAPISATAGTAWYDVNHDGKPDFGVRLGPDGRVDSLLYDDLENGTVSRSYRLADYADSDVPHVILLLDSLPYHSVVERYAAGGLRFFGPPQKIIPPFPSLTEICYSSVLHCPPLTGMIDQSYDPKTKAARSAFWPRVWGYTQPWEQRCDYHASFYEDGLSFLHPRPWYAAELERARAAVDASPNRVTVVYLGSAASMVCKYGKPGVDEVLDGAEQLCLQLLYERHGAIKISMMADHGHNLMRSTNLPIAQYMTDAGFHPSDTLAAPNDVFLEVNGLVTYAAIQTTQPIRVADALVTHPQIELAMYLDGNRVIVRSAAGSAAIECLDQRFRYVPITGDVLGYQSIVQSLQAAGKADAQGYVADADWFSATVDADYPDAPRRLWDAFHATAVDPPRVMFTTKDGYCAGLTEYEKYITMESTHGGLNQINSATFLVSMTDNRVTGPMRSREILGHIEPGFEPIAKGGK